jgi:DNA-binding NtrC family response regulator
MFGVRLPISDIPLDSPRRAREAAREPVCNARSRVRILVVDDEEFITHLIHEVLRTQAGCFVARASNVDEAIQRIEEESFDAIISDIRMPRRNGTELLRWLGKFRPQMAGRFCFVTGDASVVDVGEEFGLGRVPVLRKPFQVDTLMEMIDCLLEGRGGAAVPPTEIQPGNQAGLR